MQDYALLMGSIGLFVVLGSSCICLEKLTGMPFRKKTNNVNYLNPKFRTVINLIINEIVFK